MNVVRTIDELRDQLRSASRPIGFVPTMGYLHEGHLSLVRRARAECATVLMSIFVNPTQFGPSEDFGRYPRDLDRDLAMAKAESADVVFVPEVEAIYPPGFATFVEVERLTRRWEGERRPGHFRGVATVVTKLLNLACADAAYFGEKDYQQLQVVRRLIADLAIPTRIVGCPTVREPDGLALSSRNVYLGPADRQRATVLFRALRRAQETVDAGRVDRASIEQAMADCFAEAGVRLDYAAIVDPATLEPVETVEDEARVVIAAFVGGVRLIDNGPLVRR
ncbi:MAG: pantoate--beta-alanine ligase [Chloroflexi bacterium]|nr:pantoate--beta-alanine ligase [Chloroflexota bacterium]